MPLDSVPWFVGGGAQHSPEVARTLAYAATGGKRGIISPYDLKVYPTAVPGSNVQVAVGAAVIPSQSATGRNQSYVARMNTADTVAIAPTTSSGGRSDLVVIQIEDPWVSGEPWQNPSDPTAGPYVFTRVISNVPAGTTDLNNVSGYSGRTAITLARIDIPASTGTITSAMIKDLRRVANPRTETQNGAGVLTGKTVTLSTTTWQNFPENPITGFTVPEWATHAVITEFASISYQSGNALANLQSFMTTANGVLDSTTLFSDQQIDFSMGANGYRQAVVMPTQGDWAIPTSLRGQDVRLVTRVRGYGASDGAKISTGQYDYYTATVTFKEKSV